MFFNKVKIMKRKLKDKKWLRWKLEELIDFSEWLHNFKDFKCNAAFVGKVKADHNREWYHKRHAKNIKRISFIRRMLKDI